MGIFRLLKNLARAVWRGLDTLRRVLHLILLVGLFIVLLAGSLGRQTPLPPSAALLINPTGVLVEQLEGSPVDRAIAQIRGDLPPQTLLKDIVDSLERAVDDDRIKAVVLQLDGLEGGGLAKLQDVGRALDEVRAAGKPVIAVGNGFTRDQYYLAARADEIIMHSFGLVYLEGYEYYRTFFRGAIDKLKVDLNVFRVGEYKSFVEPYIRDDMSEEDKEASRRWLTALWTSWQHDVAAGRSITPEAISAYANGLPRLLEQTGGDAAKAAVEAGLVDKLMSRTEAEAYLIGVAGEDPFEESTFSAVDFRSYAHALRLETPFTAGRTGNVGVIIAAGTIVDGPAPPGTVGGDTLAAQLRDARLDDAVDAVVIRIDSPGGSMFASEIIFEEIEALKAAGKPVVASMSSVAASGGYYIAMLADEIWASDTTITGSIGVGALFPTVQRSLDSLGIHVDGIGTTELAGQLRLDRKLGDDARRVLDLSVNDAYRIFVGKVAESRGMSVERADSIARGRVWIGRDAHDFGLVDELGGLEDAIASAAAQAGLEENSYGVRYLEPKLSFMQRLAMEFIIGARRVAARAGFDAALEPSPGFVKRTLGLLDRQVKELARFNDPRGIYYHCFCVVE